MLVDAAAAHLIRDPAQFDVIVTTNMFGDILSDEASELSGSLGLAASLNAGAQRALAQAQHGSAPDIAGLDVANPLSLIGSAAMLLVWLAERRSEARLARAAQLIEEAIDHTLSDPSGRTRDLGGRLGTKAFSRQLTENLENLARGSRQSN
jgi:3-isopropylmalate dehydrogenase